MSEKIPDKREVRKWYFKTLELPNFIDTLNSYEKDELLRYTYSEINKITDMAIVAFSRFPEENYPEDLPFDKRYEFVFNYHFKNVSSIREARFILNLFGIDWTIEKSFYKLQEPQQTNDKNDNVGKEYTVKQIAFYIFFKGFVYQNPATYPDPENKIIEIASHFKIESRKRLYDSVQKIKKAHEEEEGILKISESIKDHFEVSANKCKKDIHKILGLLDQVEREKASEYVNAFEKIEKTKY